MRRPAHGSTTHPLLSRPGNGFGRPSLQRPGPLYAVEPAPALDLSWFLDPQRAPMATPMARAARPDEIWLTDDRP